jgi:excisionase family DNA binding protein
MAMLNVVQLEQATGGSVSRHTWRAWIRQGKIAVVRLGRRVMVRDEDLQRFIEENRIPARGDAR